MSLATFTGIKRRFEIVGTKNGITVIDPKAIVSGGPTQIAISPTRAAGIMPIITVGQPTEIGPPT